VRRLLPESFARVHEYVPLPDVLPEFAQILLEGAGGDGSVRVRLVELVIDSDNESIEIGGARVQETVHLHIYVEEVRVDREGVIAWDHVRVSQCPVGYIKAAIDVRNPLAIVEIDAAGPALDEDLVACSGKLLDV
jgi:hypothetical protein